MDKETYEALKEGIKYLKEYQEFDSDSDEPVKELDKIIVKLESWIDKVAKEYTK